MFALNRVRELFHGLSRRPFFRNVAIVGSGAVIAQILTFAFTPIITRLYGPEVYGVAGVFVAIAGVFTSTAALSYELAIILPRSENEANKLTLLAFLLGLLTSITTLLVILLFGETIVSMLGVQAIAPYLLLLPVFMLASVVLSIAAHWCIRKKIFSLTAKAAVIQSFTTGAFKTGIGAFHPSPLVLIVSSILGVVAGALTLVFGFRRVPKHNGSNPGENTDRNMLKLAKSYHDFPCFRAPQVLVNALSATLPSILLLTFFSSSAAGYYTLAASVLVLPARLIGSSVVQVFDPRINEAIRNGEDARILIIKATLGMAAVGIIPFAIVVFWGPILFQLVFGTEWRTAGGYAQWLSFWIFLQFINKPAVSAIPALRLQRGLLLYEFFSTAAKVIALYYGYIAFDSDIIAVGLFSISGGIAYLCLILWVVSRSPRYRPEFSL